MKIYGLEKISMVDFDGHLCATVFTAGCNFRCPFCHNADLVNGTNLSEISEDEFFNYLNKRKGMLDSVCVSGGEPTLQKDLEPFIKKIKELGFLVKLDTNGTNPQILKELVSNGLLDYVAMDIKNCRENYLKTAGKGNFDLNKIDESIAFLKTGVVPYEFRTTLISGHHTADNIKKMGAWIEGADKLYLQHFVDSGNCIKEGMSEIPQEQAEKFKAILEKYVKHVHLRGY